MAALIKNQILKHLSKFVVNLSPSQINLSTLKGEGELTGLELNCVVLTQLLELPVWVRSGMETGFSWKLHLCLLSWSKHNK